MKLSTRDMVYLCTKDRVCYNTLCHAVFKSYSSGTRILGRAHIK